MAAVFDTVTGPTPKLAGFGQAFAAKVAPWLVEVALNRVKRRLWRLVKTPSVKATMSFLFIANAIDTARGQHAREQDVQRADRRSMGGHRTAVEFGGKAVDSMLSRFLRPADRSPEYQLFRQSLPKTLPIAPGFAPSTACNNKAVLDALARGGIRGRNRP